MFPIWEMVGNVSLEFKTGCNPAKSIFLILITVIFGRQVWPWLSWLKPLSRWGFHCYTRWILSYFNVWSSLHTCVAHMRSIPCFNKAKTCFISVLMGAEAWTLACSKQRKLLKWQALRAYNPPDDRNTCSVWAHGWLYERKWLSLAPCTS